MMIRDLLARVLEIRKCTVRQLAVDLDVKNHQTFYNWTKVPAEYVLKLAELTGMHPSEIRPDLYPAEGIPPAKTGE